MDTTELRTLATRALLRVSDPSAEGDVVSSGRLAGLQVGEDGEVRVRLRVRSGDPDALLTRVREAVSRVEGVRRVRVEVSAEGGAEGRPPGPADTSASPGAPEGAGGAGSGEGPGPAGRGRSGSGRSLPVVGPGGGAGAASRPGGGPRDRSPPGGGRGPGGAGGGRTGHGPVSREEASRHPSEAEGLEGVGCVVAVSSGKGGVGKSTVASNLAAAWAAEGHRVGLMDADIYGPDIPTMFGIYERPRMADDEVVPLEAHGVKLMSLGFLVDEDTPAIWRGPIIMGIVRQFLRQVRWGELDYLVVDLPPGTGDAQLSLVQLVRVSGAVLVTTPQDVAVGGVLKGIRMFQKVDVPVAGVVENMRGFVCPSCGERHDVFGSGGGEKLATSLGLPFLGAVPLGVAVREEGDRGVPTAIGRPDSPEGRAFRRIARTTAERLRELAGGEGAAGEEAGVRAAGKRAPASGR